jgi:hypothetical protein
VKNHEILKQEKTQLKYYIEVTLPTLLCGSEFCTIKARDINEIQSTEIKYLRTERDHTRVAILRF